VPVRQGPREALDKVAALPVTTWGYKAESGVRHIVPTAEDLYRALPGRSTLTEPKK